MADDIDELLNEVESTFLDSSKNKSMLYKENFSEKDTTTSTRTSHTKYTRGLGPNATSAQSTLEPKTCHSSTSLHSQSKTNDLASYNYRHDCFSERTSTDAALDAMIDDIFDDKPQSTTHQKSPCLSSSNVSRSSSLASGSQKCFPVFIGGSKCAHGLGTSIHKRTCDQLRCTDCDFTVCTFDDFSWQKSVDYLFLRNNMPDPDRLCAKLIPRKGCRAYCCQCKWQSASSLAELPAGFKWVCGKH